MKSIADIVSNNDDLALAQYLAEKLNDLGSVSYYHILAQTYSHQLLLEVLKGVLAVPQEKIHTRRAAIFVANIKRYAPGR